MRSQAACTNTVRRHIQALAPSPRPLAATCPVIHKRACCMLTKVSWKNECIHHKASQSVTKRHKVSQSVTKPFWTHFRSYSIRYLLVLLHYPALNWNVKGNGVLATRKPEKRCETQYASNPWDTWKPSGPSSCPSLPLDLILPIELPWDPLPWELISPGHPHLSSQNMPSCTWRLSLSESARLLEAFCSVRACFAFSLLWHRLSDHFWRESSSSIGSWRSTQPPQNGQQHIVANFWIKQDPHQT